MNHVLDVQIVSPVKRVATLLANLIEAPGQQGRFGVRVGHVDFIAGLQPGVLRVRQHQPQLDFYFYVSDGLLSIAGPQVHVLAETIETPDQINSERLEQAHKRATTRLAAAARGEVDVSRALRALGRAEARRALLAVTQDS